MSKSISVGFMMIALLAIACVGFGEAFLAQGNVPLIPLPFANATVRPMYDDRGDLMATYEENGGALRITVRRTSRQTGSGWAGVCIQNPTSINLGTFSRMTASIEPSSRVAMDIKLERTNYRDGTLLLADHEMVSAGPQALNWVFRDAQEVGDSGGTLAETRRWCAYILADTFPAGQSQVTVRVSNLRFIQ